MGQFRDRGRQGPARRQRAFAAAVAARLDEMRLGVEADLVRFGRDVMHQYRLEQVQARLCGDWAGFRHADDKLSYLRRITD